MAAVIIIAYGDEPCLIPKPESYPALLSITRRSFPGLVAFRDVDISFRLIPEGFNMEAKLDPSAYHAVQDRALLRIVVPAPPAIPPPPYIPRVISHIAGAVAESERSHDVCAGDGPMFIDAIIMAGKTVRVPVPSLQVSLQHLRDVIYEKEGIPRDQQRWIFRGRQLASAQRLDSYGVQSGSTLCVTRRLTGAKPAVYLLSPCPIPEASVTVELSPQWEPSVLYPPAEVSSSDAGEGYRSRITWEVSVDEGGYVVDRIGGLQHTYLFWEATTTTTTTPPTTSREPPGAAPAFDPARPVLAPGNSVVLSFDDAVPYLERALPRLGLAPAMRHEFMVYWMPRLLGIRDGGLDVAVSFVGQAALGGAARLTVVPRPAAVARVFMLLGGVDAAPGGPRRWEAWRGSRLGLARALRRVDWARRIGLDVEGMGDESRFRVLEWGGMEVPSHMLMSAV